jgi:pimeloyl-ACP methyl ester carboxylesterase
MEGVGHGPMIERPDESAELVKGFLNSLNTLMVFEE